MRWAVVGGGTAGCVVASRLSERADHEVILLEAGPDHGPEPAPGDVGPYFDDPARLRTEMVVRRPGARPEPYVQGSGLGGSGLVNGGLVGSGPTGSLPVEPPWATGAVGRALLASAPGATRVGLARVRGRRTTTADVYLRPVSGRGNLTVRTGLEVSRVLLDGRRAVGVVASTGEVVHSDRVVLCAGAVRTPTILLRSGVDTPGIGEGLQDHPAFTVTLRLVPGVVDPSTPTISVVATGGDHQVVALDHLPGTPGLGALTIGLLDVRSTGSVRLPDPDGPPLVELQQLTDATDRDRLCAAVLRTIELLGHRAWEGVFDEAYVDAEGTPAAVIAGSPERAGDWIVEHLGGHHHMAGTCAEGVVTDAGVVRGHTGLYVCDASLFTGVPVVNPYGPLVDLAERIVRSWA